METLAYVQLELKADLGLDPYHSIGLDLGASYITLGACQYKHGFTN